MAGPAYADAMVDDGAGPGGRRWRRWACPVFAAERGATASHQFAVLAQAYGGGQRARTAAARQPARPAASGSDRAGRRRHQRAADRHPRDHPARDDARATCRPGLVRRPRARGDESAAAAGPEVTEWRSGFSGIHFTTDLPDLTTSGQCPPPDQLEGRLGRERVERAAADVAVGALER